MVKSLNEINIGQTEKIYVLCKECIKDIARNGKEYQRVIITDLNTEDKTAMIFNNLIDFENPVVLKANIQVDEYQGTKSYIITECEKTNDVEISKFMPKAKIDVKESWQKFVGYIKSLPDDYEKLVCSLIDTKKFPVAPLTVAGPFSRQSGILEFTLKMIEMSMDYAKLGNINKDILVTACMLCNIGVCDTISSAYTYTPEDVLIGPAIKSYAEIYNKAKELSNSEKDEEKIDISKEELDMICHIVLSTCRGFSPAILEGTIIKNLDMTLREMDSILNSLEGVKECSIINGINTKSKRLYKSKVVTKESVPEAEEIPPTEVE